MSTDSLIEKLKAVEVLMLNEERYEYANALGVAIAAMGGLSRTDTIDSCADDDRGLPANHIGDVNEMVSSEIPYNELMSHVCLAYAASSDSKSVDTKAMEVALREYDRLNAYVATKSINWTELAEKYPSVLRNEIKRMKESINIMEIAIGDSPTTTPMQPVESPYKTVSGKPSYIRLTDDLDHAYGQWFNSHGTARHKRVEDEFLFWCSANLHHYRNLKLPVPVMSALTKEEFVAMWANSTWASSTFKFLEREGLKICKI